MMSVSLIELLLVLALCACGAVALLAIGLGAAWVIMDQRKKTKPE